MIHFLNIILSHLNIFVDFYDLLKFLLDHCASLYMYKCIPAYVILEKQNHAVCNFVASLIAMFHTSKIPILCQPQQ